MINTYYYPMKKNDLSFCFCFHITLPMFLFSHIICSFFWHRLLHILFDMIFLSPGIFSRFYDVFVLYFFLLVARKVPFFHMIRMISHFTSMIVLWPLDIDVSRENNLLFPSSEFILPCEHASGFDDHRCLHRRKWIQEDDVTLCQ